MNDVVDETLGDADPNDYVRIVMSSDDFDRSLNTPYMLRSNINGDWLSELAGKLLQSHETIDLENNFILHVQHVRLPRGNGACKRKIAVSMLQNILLKHCVVTSIAQHYDVPCFGYALFVACTHLDKSLTAIQGFVTDKNNLVEEIRDIFTVAGVEYGPVDFSQYHRFLPCLPPNSRLIIIDAKEQNRSLLYKSDVVNPDSSNPVRNVCLLLFKHHIGVVPKPISDLFQTNDNFHSYSTRNSQALRTPIGKSEAIYQTFTYIGSLAWNYISSKIPTDVSYICFKNYAKLHIQANSLPQIRLNV